MLISELIESLKEAQEEFGDIPVFIEHNNIRTGINLLYYAVIDQDEHGNPFKTGIIVSNNI
jgi:hypothetical protein